MLRTIYNIKFKVKLQHGNPAMINDMNSHGRGNFRRTNKVTLVEIRRKDRYQNGSVRLTWINLPKYFTGHITIVNFLCQVQAGRNVDWRKRDSIEQWHLPLHYSQNAK